MAIEHDDLAYKKELAFKTEEMTPVGFEPTQLALVELESTPLDHSGKVSMPKEARATEKNQGRRALHAPKQEMVANNQTEVLNKATCRIISQEINETHHFRSRGAKTR